MGGCCFQGVMQPHDSDRSAGKAEAGINNYHEKVSAQGQAGSQLPNANDAIFQIKVFLCLIRLSQNGSFKSENFKTKSLSYRMQLRAGDVSVNTDQICEPVAGLPGGRRCAEALVHPT